jgi:hypothetical protein
MFKRIIIALTFITTLGAASLAVTPSAEAWRYWGRPYRAYYAPRAAYYGPVVPYRAYYGPRIVRPYYTTYYAYPAYPDYYYAPGVTVSYGY